MGELKNSQRINYKATYVQTQLPDDSKPHETEPHQEGRGDRPYVLQRAVEKAAFVQALQVRPQELSEVARMIQGQSAGSADVDRQLAALEEIRQVVEDTSLLSTLNNAKRFADVPWETLTQVTQHLQAHRNTAFEEATQIVAAIAKAHIAAQARPQPAAPPTLPTTIAREETVTAPTYGTTTAGVPIRILAKRQPAREGRPVTGEGKRATERTSVVIESLEPGVSLAPPVPGAGPGTPSASASSLIETLRWGETAQPDLLERLHARVSPYSTASGQMILPKPRLPAIVDGLSRLQSSAKETGAALVQFEARKTIDPVGRLHLERIQMSPAGIERGELVHSVPLTPKETVNISHKEWSVREEEFETIVQDYFEGYSEEGVAEKNELAQSSESQSKHATALNLGASLSASYSSVTLSTSFGYNATSDDEQSKKDSRNHSMENTKKASARTKKEHKFTFKVSSAAGSVDQAVRTITNPFDAPMRVDYFQLVRKWKVDLYRYGLRMTYDIVIPDPGAALITKLQRIEELNELIDQPFAFDLPLDAITYNSLATDPLKISNYDTLAAKYDATVTPPPEARKWVSVHKETAEVDHYDYVHFDSIEFEIDDDYWIYEIQYDQSWQNNENDNRSYFLFLNDNPNVWGPENLVGKSGKLSLDIVYQYIWNYAVNIVFRLRPKVEVLKAWRLKVWNELREAAQEQYLQSRQIYKDERAALLEEIGGYDALTLRRMEQEEVMKGVLRWLFGPSFQLVPSDISSLFMLTDSNDPDVKDVLDPNQLTDTAWLRVMEHGEFIKYIHNAIEWESVLYFTYPYFWDKNGKWDFKKFLYHPDSRHRVFLRSGAARVVLTIRPGFEDSFSQLVESGSFQNLPGPHPYVTIAQEIQNFASTNYPGFPPANPEQNARPLLYLEQRRVWKEMQYIIQLLNAFRADPGNGGLYPAAGGGNSVPAVALGPYLNGPIVIDGVNYAGVNGYNNDVNAKQLALDPNTPLDALLPTYVNIPTTDLWGNQYFYKSPGDSGDYDLISFGADGKVGGADKNADIPANAEASLVATWFEYTPTSALDLAVSTNLSISTNLPDMA